MLRYASFLFLMLVSAVFALPAFAELIRITPTGVAVPEQVVTDPVPIGADGFRLTYHGGGSKEIINPLLLIFATPDGVTPTLANTGVSEPISLTAGFTLGGTNIYGGSWNTATGDAGTYDSVTSSPNLSVYEVIGLTPDGSDSQNYPNWTGASGLDSWQLFVYQIAFSPLFSRGDWIEFSTTNLALGSFVVGYGCTETTAGTSGPVCNNPGATESTPFTFAGFVTDIPEPDIPEPFTAPLIVLGIFIQQFRFRKRRSTH